MVSMVHEFFWLIIRIFHRKFGIGFNRNLSAKIHDSAGFHPKEYNNRQNVSNFAKTLGKWIIWENCGDTSTGCSLQW